MSLFNHLSIKTKLNILIFTSSLLMIVIGFMGLFGINSTNTALSNVYNNRLQHIIQLNDVRNFQNRVRAELHDAAQERDGFVILEHIDRVRSNMFKIETTLNEYKQAALTPEEKKLMDDFVAKRLEYGRNGVIPIMDMLQAEKFEQAEKISRNIMIPGFSKASDAIDAMIALQGSEAQKEYNHVITLAKIIRIASIVIILIGLALSISLGLFITHSVKNGVRELAKAASKLSQGELTARSALNSQDELGEVSRAFNQMAEEFSLLIEKVRESAEQVIEASEAQADIAEKVASISGSQNSQAALAASSIDQLNESVKLVAQNTLDVLDNVNATSKVADEGQRVVNRAVLGIQQVEMTVQDSARLIAALGQRSDQIGQIINVIRDIAEQTNLLALNAAIEAARAGEQGRGFAVVADEVRKLAERTANSTSEISDMISAIQEETHSVVSTMERGSSEVNDGVTLANQAGKALQDINTSVKHVLEMIEQISRSTRTQSESTNDLAQQVDQIATMAKENSSSIDRSTRASQDLQKLSTHLQEVVSRFRL